MDTHLVTSEHLSLKELYQIFNSDTKLALSASAIDKIRACRAYLDQKIEKSDRPIYGINTGFGALHNVAISDKNLTILQENLVRSHACGLGDEVPKAIVKMMLWLKIRTLSFGHSGVQLATVERLIDFYNHDILPVIYTKGSLGASGDLAPLAHLALPLIGEGDVWYQGKRQKAKAILAAHGWDRIELQSKEGLALLNGTQFMSAYGIICLFDAYKLSYFADLIGALSLDAFDGRIEPFDALVHLVRPHRGQITTAKRIQDMLEDSELMRQPKKHVQDPYSFRCIPQVHGASKDALEHIKKTIVAEINGVTDNPNIFVQEDKIISGGNFHGQPLALVLDYLKIAMAELGNISERRTFQLLSGDRNLPQFLVDNPGLNSGLMIPQYTAASIVSYNKQLATPASIDSIVSSNGQEDHVSMGANAAVQLYELIHNLFEIFAVELKTAAQALEFRRPLKTSRFLEQFLAAYRDDVDALDKDRILHDDLVKTVHFLQAMRLDENMIF